MINIAKDIPTSIFTNSVTVWSIDVVRDVYLQYVIIPAH